MYEIQAFYKIPRYSIQVYVACTFSAIYEMNYQNQITIHVGLAICIMPKNSWVLQSQYISINREQNIICFELKQTRR